MTTFLILLVSLVVGAFGHAVLMKVNFKQRTIDNKIKIYDAIISHWANMRNHVYHQLNVFKNPQAVLKFDEIYGLSQTVIGEIFLVCENTDLAVDINTLNEKFYRMQWLDLTYEQQNKEMEKLKIEALIIVKRMQGDIKESTRIERSDVQHILGGLFKKTSGISPKKEKPGS